MIDILLIGFSIILLSFGLVVFFGAPYVPTLKPQIVAALDLLDLKPGQTMIEVGSGDGRVLKAAAERGITVIGYEMNLFLVIVSMWQTRKLRKLVTIVWGNAFSKKWPLTDGVFIFGIARLMTKLHTKIVQNESRHIKVASIAFQMPHTKATQTKDGVFLYQLNKHD